MEVQPYKQKVVRGRDTRWYRVPHGLQLKQNPRYTHKVEAKIEQFSPTLWIFTLAAHAGNGGSPRHFPNFESAENFWKFWLARRTESRY